MIDPQIAVIDLTDPSLQGPNKQIKASKCLEDLKAIGQAPWAKNYKGTTELMVCSRHNT